MAGPSRKLPERMVTAAAGDSLGGHGGAIRMSPRRAAVSRCGARALVLSLLVLTSVGSTHPARAQSPSPASAASEPQGYAELIDEALREYRARHFEEARALFTRAHALFPNARTLRGVGMADFELRDYADSVEHLEAALASNVRPLSGSLREETEALAARAATFVARIALSVRPRSAEITLDGAPVERAEKVLLLEVGEHVLELHATGYGPERRVIKVRGGESERLDIALVPTVNEQSPTVALGAPTGPRKDDGESAMRPLYRNPWLWTGVGLVVAGAAAGAGVYFLKGRDERVGDVPVSGEVGRVTAP